MNSAHLQIDGLRELLDALRDLPKELTGDASAIVHDEGSASVSEIKENYPPGPLRDGVEAIPLNSQTFATGIMVVNNDPIAWIYENGSELRFYNGMPRGRMPPGHAFIPPMIRHRRVMYQKLKAMMESHGITVEGEI